MAEFDIFEIHHRFEDEDSDGKLRPSVVIAIDEKWNQDLAGCYKLRPKHLENEKILEKSYVLQDWSEAGLRVPTLVRLDRLVSVGLLETFHAKYVGTLSLNDAQGLVQKLLEISKHEG